MTHIRGTIRGESARRACDVRHGARVEDPVLSAVGLLMVDGELIDPNGTELASRMGKVDLVKLVAKCGGLLKVVAAIGKVSWAFLEHMNDDFMFKLETDPQFHSLSGLLSWMHSYFDACPDSVKPCIFYLSVFPASSKIRRGYLLRRWIAEGYCRDTPGCTAKENAQKRLSELVELSIIQQGTRQSNCLSELVQWSITQQATSKNNFKVNGFFLEYIISRPMEDNLVFALDGRCSPNTQRTGQHLTIMADWHRDQNVFESIDFARLRSLTVFGTWCSFFISDKMKRLRVLDLEDMIAVTNDDLEQIFLKLLSLKFISLRGCRKISRLPDTLEGLRQLQTLDVRFTSIVMLPSAIIKLHKLQYIRAGTDQDWTSASTSSEFEGRDSSISAGQPTVPASPENPAQAARSPEASHRSMVPKVGWASKLSRTWSSCAPHHNGGVKVPVGIEKLAALHAVGVVNVSAAGGEAFLKQLARLTQLLKLRVCGINKKNWELLCSALSDHGRLESLSVRFDEDCLGDSFKPPMTLKSLKLYGPMSRLPDTIKALVNLKKLDLEMTITGPDDVHFFLKEKLPCMIILNRLCINVQGDQKVDLASRAFPCFEFNWDDPCKPRVLKMDCSSKLEVIFRYGGIFEYVEVLIIQCSKGSSFRVSGDVGLSGMDGLKTVWLKGSYSEELRQQLKELVDDHSRKPVLKLEPLQ
ncbi:disease resistance protein Pik-2-like [Aegilops tauschii subsp. strangulata]|uniref:Disease resistance protein RPM1 n=1 Tax=Aegilops tauschii TaxID=37682 RepID=R7W1Z0_AEGTA